MKIPLGSMLFVGVNCVLSQPECSYVQQFRSSVIYCSMTDSLIMNNSLINDVQEDLVNSVAFSRYSFGYDGLDALKAHDSEKTFSQTSCTIKHAQLVNKAGFAVRPSVSSVQAAVRWGATNLLQNSTCPGFGFCGNLLDGDDEDVWPITAITVGGLWIMLIICNKLTAI